MKPQITSYNQLQTLKENQQAIEEAKKFLSESVIAGETLKVLTIYAENLYNRNLKVFNDETCNFMNFVTEAVLIGFDNVDQAKQIIRNRVINHKRKLMAKAQAENNDLFNITHKVCRKCQGDPKPVSEFSIRTDRNSGFKYYNNLCKLCERTRCKERRIRLKSTLKQNIQ